MVRMLVLAGFDGIYLDRWGFPDLGLGLIRALSSELRQSPRRGPDRRQVFFDLRAQRERMLERTSSGNRENLGPLLWVWRGSCHQLERTRDWTWRWCGREARLEIHNLGAGSRQIRLAMSLISGCPSASRVQVSGLMTRSLAITNKGAPLEFSGELGPGRHVLQVVTDAPRVAAAGDPRVMHFMVGGFQIAVDGG
jgi:phosphoglycerol transferase